MSLLLGLEPFQKFAVRTRSYYLDKLVRSDCLCLNDLAKMSVSLKIHSTGSQYGEWTMLDYSKLYLTTLYIIKQTLKRVNKGVTDRQRSRLSD